MMGYWDALDELFHEFGEKDEYYYFINYIPAKQGWIVNLQYFNIFVPNFVNDKDYFKNYMREYVKLTVDVMNGDTMLVLPEDKREIKVKPLSIWEWLVGLYFTIGFIYGIIKWLF